jgi:hypothetical protein
MIPMKPNAQRMQVALACVEAHPGTPVRGVVAHVLDTLSMSEAAAPSEAKALRRYKGAASVVERLIKNRHVCQRPDGTLWPWDAKRKAYAEALERAWFAAPGPAEHATLAPLVAQAWRAAGDENRARTLELLDRGKKT